jgi:hypothetical protein
MSTGLAGYTSNFNSTIGLTLCGGCSRNYTFRVAGFKLLAFSIED